ncbi:uncharacterized protein [Narcine bancroftii]|uniref:uncharacterized protein isoform X5 n=1 Tax=Narcine bancroftii TaxID=1343680 RepID=UPI003831A7CD
MESPSQTPAAADAEDLDPALFSIFPARSKRYASRPLGQTREEQKDTSSSEPNIILQSTLTTKQELNSLPATLIRKLGRSPRRNPTATAPDCPMSRGSSAGTWLPAFKGSSYWRAARRRRNSTQAAMWEESHNWDQKTLGTRLEGTRTQEEL